jgi:hypothetical protein
MAHDPDLDHILLFPEERVEDLKVWRVYNGYVGFGNVHRIVVAYTEDDAIGLALSAGMECGRSGLRAEYVMGAQGGNCEMEDFDG